LEDYGGNDLWKKCFESGVKERRSDKEDGDSSDADENGGLWHDQKSETAQAEIAIDSRCG